MKYQKNTAGGACTAWVKVVPGISALDASAARLSAPFMHDLVVICLSDRLTSWKLIAKILEVAPL